MERVLIGAGRLFACIAAALLLVPAQSAAEEAPEKPWRVDVELGGVLTRGSTETQSLLAKLGVAYEAQPWRHVLRLEALHASDRETTTAQKFLASAKSDYKFTEFNYVFATVRYEDDRFSGFDYRVSEAVGYGRRLVQTDRITLDLEAGPGGRHSKLELDGTEDEVILRGAARLAAALGPGARFRQEVTAESGKDSTVIESETSADAKLIGNLAMKLSFTLKHRTSVPPDTRETDTITAVTLVYSF